MFLLIFSFQVLQLSKDHELAKTVLNKAKLFKEKKDLALRALNEVTEKEQYYQVHSLTM